MRRHTAVSYTVLLDDQFRGLRQGDSSPGREFAGRDSLRPLVDARMPAPPFFPSCENAANANREFLSRPSAAASWTRFPKSSLLPFVSKRRGDLTSTFGEEGRLS